MYDEEVNRGICKKYLPEPNPAKIEISKNTSYSDLLEVAKSRYFSEFQPEAFQLSLADSTGMPIMVANPDSWTVGNFYCSNSLQPSRYKLYVVLKVSFSLCGFYTMYVCMFGVKNYFSLDGETKQWW